MRKIQSTNQQRNPREETVSMEFGAEILGEDSQKQRRIFCLGQVCERGCSSDGNASQSMLCLSEGTPSCCDTCDT